MFLDQVSAQFYPKISHGTTTFNGDAYHMHLLADLTSSTYQFSRFCGDSKPKASAQDFLQWLKNFGFLIYHHDGFAATSEVIANCK